MASDNENKKYLQCTFCDYNYTQKYGLEKLIDSVHDNKRSNAVFIYASKVLLKKLY